MRGCLLVVDDHLPLAENFVVSGGWGQGVGGYHNMCDAFWSYYNRVAPLVNVRTMSGTVTMLFIGELTPWVFVDYR